MITDRTLWELQDVAQLFLCLKKLVSSVSSLECSELKIASKRLQHLENGLMSISDTLSSFTAESNICLIQHSENSFPSLGKNYLTFIEEFYHLISTMIVNYVSYCLVWKNHYSLMDSEFARFFTLTLFLPLHRLPKAKAFPNLMFQHLTVVF